MDKKEKDLAEQSYLIDLKKKSILKLKRLTMHSTDLYFVKLT